MVIPLLMEIRERLMAGGELKMDVAVQLMACDEREILYLAAVANEVREKFVGRQVDLCSIINARSGNCPEDCAFCAQSGHHRAEAPVFPLKNEEEIVAAAKRAEEAGAARFCIVTAGRGQGDGREFDFILSALTRIKEETGLLRCCSLGILNKRQLKMLKEVGVSRYHHNLETAESFFSEVCSTHSWEKRAATVKTAREAGLEVCSGGIFGMGETPGQRLELAFALKDLDVNSVPINILNPIPGTKLAGASALPPLEIVKTIALFRLILPGKILRYGGGRETKLRDLQSLGMVAGINGLLLGDYLTTGGRGADVDMAMINDLAMVPGSI
jgi:biotin synthase